jgi:hypothetical protein
MLLLLLCDAMPLTPLYSSGLLPTSTAILT